MTSMFSNAHSCGWRGGALADDGLIYCAPFITSQALANDQLNALSITINESMWLYPDELVRLFVQNGEYYEESLYESTVRKFGDHKALMYLMSAFPLVTMTSNGLKLSLIVCSFWQLRAEMVLLAMLHWMWSINTWLEGIYIIY